MFGADRFSETENFGATYQQIGGNFLSEEAVNYIIRNLCNTMFADYGNPDYYENFPSVSSYLETMGQTKDLPCVEISLLEQVFAMHEAGVISEPYVSILHQLRQTHEKLNESFAYPDLTIENLQELVENDGRQT
ncbi:hypothetical protein F7734_43700 [Scytonema sp. UIC 10036]|uniref:hypothetical protein n=1 Tax=Scytonema sp. UIC 10036 TaxID=2304196 RepID=UPI0012DA8769|nr:hypothetical protein [Scytonema sp. UIC 10036]MUG98835.1 hypothetical protein [Scytonema sp. UIC 10036]